MPPQRRFEVTSPKKLQVEETALIQEHRPYAQPNNSLHGRMGSLSRVLTPASPLYLPDERFAMFMDFVYGYVDLGAPPGPLPY